MFEGYDLRERVRELEEYLWREGRYAEFLELAGSSKLVTHIVGRVIFTLLEDRDATAARISTPPADLGPGSGFGRGLDPQPGNFPAFAYGRGRLCRHQGSLRPDVRD
jgi:hypothetical protein